MEEKEQVTLEGGTYEIIRNRLNAHGKELRGRIAKLNEARKSVFGSIETKLLGSDRITTDNNCTPRDIVPIGNKFIFGYNVQVGLRAEIRLEDVFAVYRFEDHAFYHEDLSLMNNAKFHEDFANLYRYYKNTIFVKFAVIGPHLFMVFRVGKSVSDIKTFKWLLKDDKLTYVDNRSDAEYKIPNQHDFVWKRASRDYHRSGEHPHVSIEDRVFVETVGGDLTIKIEDNTRDGAGIYNEPVDDPDQTLDDAEFFYTIVGHLILLKIKPYQEKNFRYFVFNEKLQNVTRIDSIKDTCVFLPDDHGIIFPNGYYLAAGEYKIFENDLKDMSFERRVSAPNGEDYLYVFYQREHGHFILLSYNLIEQTVATPILCEGFSLFRDGELVYFRAEEEPQKHHTLQFWQTPYVGSDVTLDTHADSALFKIGNKDIVRAMAECHEVLVLIGRDEVYASLYVDIVKKTGDIADSYFWLGDDQTFNLREVLAKIKETSGAAVDEFDKVQKVKKGNQAQVEAIQAKTRDLLGKVKRARFDTIDEFVHLLAELRALTGEIISARELRYVDIEAIGKMEEEVRATRDKLSGDCVAFLLKPEALAPYETRIKEQTGSIQKLGKVAEAKKVEEEIDAGAGELELLIEIVSNLKIDDPTQTTAIIDRISELYTRLNQIKAELKNKRKDLARTEGVAEFNAQLKLLGQAMINYLDVCDEPEKCDTYLTKLMVQVEELEGKFVDFDEFIVQLTEKRDEIYNAFEARKLNLVESRNKRANALMSAADRILKGIGNRIGQFQSVNEINGYFAGDLMIEKLRDIVQKLVDLDDSVKADSIQSRMKSIREDAIRQLKDRQDLFEGGENVIRLGGHKFSVNVQDLALTIVAREDGQYFHLTGTNFFEQIDDPEFVATREVWDQEYPSENGSVYRGEFLAYHFLLDCFQRGELAETGALDGDQLLERVRVFMGPRYQEGYSKGVHDHDASVLLGSLLKLHQSIGLLIYPSEARACASVFWHAFCPPDAKAVFEKAFRGLGAILELFPDPEKSETYVGQLTELITGFIARTGMFSEIWIKDAANYLFRELVEGKPFCISGEAARLYHDFEVFLKRNKFEQRFAETAADLKDLPADRFRLLRDWIAAFIKKEQPEKADYRDEVAALFFRDGFERSKIIDVPVRQELEGLRGDHAVIENGCYALSYNHFIQKIETYQTETVPRFNSYVALKKALTEKTRKQMKLDEFKPRILSSFVRNQLIDKVYLPMIGDNLAKQIGVVGEKKRTDLMGLLLLVSPPGYGKTTLMEYIADRLGLIFVKINGPAIGHKVTAVDPAEAPNSAARDELAKLNLAFEMGDNIMIYLDDIQHCNPELLQKFISLCDGQRKIEGVYKGVSRTYDLRGKKVAVVMAGNPYTESGDKFQIPDMLANRADTYNLGDIIGESEDVFRMSYLENCLTSNSYLNKLMSRSQKDVYGLIKIAETGSREGIEFESNFSADEIEESVSVLKKLLRVRDVILAVNLGYVRSAAQADEYRTEPPFKLQGSYRNMNKIAEKVLPIMNDEELETLVLSHYENESQTLTSGAEANLLKFKELTGRVGEEEQQRWEDIKGTFRKNLSLHAAGGDRMGQAVLQLAGLSEGLTGIRDAMTQAVQEKPEDKSVELHELIAKTLAHKPGGSGLDDGALNRIGEMVDRLGEVLSRPRPAGLDEDTLVGIRKIAAGAVRTLIKQRSAGLDEDSLAAMKTMFSQAMESMTVERKTGGIDEDTLTAIKETVKILRASALVQGREERQAMLILLEKQFQVMEQWLKPMQEMAHERDSKLVVIQTSLERAMKNHDWIITRLREIDQNTKRFDEDTQPDIRRKSKN